MWIHQCILWCDYGESSWCWIFSGHISCFLLSLLKKLIWKTGFKQMEVWRRWVVNPAWCFTHNALGSDLKWADLCWCRVVLQVGRGRPPRVAVRCLWGRFPETSTRTSWCLCSRERAGCTSSDWWWSSAERTAATPSSCTPTG